MPPNPPKTPLPLPPSLPTFDVEALFTSFSTGRQSRTFKTKEVIFRQGDPASAVYYIEKGIVQITVVSDQGKEGIIATLKDGDFFGEGCLAGQKFYLASASAMKQTSVVSLDKAEMIRVLQDQPALSEIFMSVLLMRNSQIESDLVDQLFNSSEKRLARALLLLANFGKESKLEAVVPKVSQDALAARVGTTRARVNFFMNKFRDLGLIEYNGDLKVHSALLNIIVQD